MIKSSFYRRGAALVTAFAASLGMQSALAQDSVEWKIGVVDPDSYFLTELTDEWARLVGERSDGVVSHRMFPSGQLGSDVAMLESITQGNLQVWEGGALTLAPFSPLNDIWALPYLFENDQHRYRFWDHHLDEVSDLVAEESGYRIVGVLNGPARQLNTKTPVVDLAEDVKGLKLRVPELQALVAFWQEAGAGPTAMPFPEVYSALETGVIDGQENDILVTEASGFFEVTSHIAMIDYVAYDAFILLKDEYYQQLSEEIKNAIATTSEEIKLKSRERWSELQAAAVERAEGEGMTITEPDTGALRQLAEGMRGSYPHVDPILDLVKQTR